jgi:Cu+-exporting ATPase
VLLLEDGFRYLCDEECRGAYLAGARERIAREPLPEGPARHDPSTGIVRTFDAASLAPLTAPAEVEDETARIEPPWVGVAAALVGVTLGFFAKDPAWAVASAAATTVSAATAILATTRARKELGLLAWATGPLGALVAALAVVLGALDGDASWSVAVGAGVAALAVTARGWLDTWAKTPVENALRALVSRLPKRVRVPVRDEAATNEVAFTELETSRVKSGEEILAVAGETVAVDGIVQGGQALVLLYPDARTPVRRGSGQPILAGARIVEGVVRILAGRVGDDRALARPERFAAGGDRHAAESGRLAGRLSSWGGAAVLLAALAAALLAGDGREATLSAAAAVLLAAPLVALRRASDLPFVAAAASASSRGIVFQNARMLDRGGRVASAALCARGTVTEGVLDVVEVHPIGAVDVDNLLALAAAAQAPAGDHPIAVALVAAETARRVPKESVRRATFLPGRGVTALAPSGESLVVGSRRLLLDEGVSVAVADAEAARAEARGHTALFVALGGHVRAVISLQDAARPGARAAVQRIFDLGVEVVLLSGDHRPTVESLAKALDVGNVRAELLPEERGAEVRRLRETGGLVAVVGRPKHDVDALTAADVPIVLGAAGNALEERGVALSTDDVRDAAAALWIARAARTEAGRALFLAVAVGSILVALGLLGFAAPAVTALAALAVDAFALPSAARLLRRIELRIPSRV